MIWIQKDQFQVKNYVSTNYMKVKSISGKLSWFFFSFSEGHSTVLGLVLWFLSLKITQNNGFISSCPLIILNSQYKCSYPVCEFTSNWCFLYGLIVVPSVCSCPGSSQSCLILFKNYMNMIRRLEFDWGWFWDFGDWSGYLKCKLLLSPVWFH